MVTLKITSIDPGFCDRDLKQGTLFAHADIQGTQTHLDIISDDHVQAELK